MKYMSRPMEVEANQYLDEYGSVDRLVGMIGDSKTVKAYVSSIPGPGRGMRVALTLKTVADRYVLAEGDWLVKNPHGGFEVWVDEAFKERFIV